jgi:acetoin utilization protein AcuB
MHYKQSKIRKIKQRQIVNYKNRTMNLAAKVSTLMTHDVISLHPKDSLKAAGEVFNKHNIHHIPIVEANILVGMLSKSDYLLFQRGFQVNNDPKMVDDVRNELFEINVIMTKGIAKLSPDDRINTALDIFKINKFHALPVVENDKLVGILTTYDIISKLAEEGSAETKYQY